MGLVRFGEIERIDPDTNGYMVLHRDGQRVHVPFRGDHPDFHAVQHYLRGHRFGEAAEAPSSEPLVPPDKIKRVMKAIRKALVG